MNPFRHTDLTPNNETRSAYRHEDSDSELDETSAAPNRDNITDKILQEENKTTTRGILNPLEMNLMKSDQKFHMNIHDMKLVSDGKSQQITPLDCALLLVAASKEANELLEYLVKDMEPQVTLRYGRGKNDVLKVRQCSSKQQRQHNTRLNALLDAEEENDDIMVLTVHGERALSTSMDPVQMMPITEMILSAVQPSNILVFDSLPVHEFRAPNVTTEDIETPKLYRMQTSHAHGKFLVLLNVEGDETMVPYLPSSNITSGLGAAFMTYCEARGVGAIMLLSLIESVRNVSCITAYSKVWPLGKSLMQEAITGLRRQNTHERLYL